MTRTVVCSSRSRGTCLGGPPSSTSSGLIARVGRCVSSNRVQQPTGTLMVGAPSESATQEEVQRISEGTAHSHSFRAHASLTLSAAAAARLQPSRMRALAWVVTRLPHHAAPLLSSSSSWHGSDASCADALIDGRVSQPGVHRHVIIQPGLAGLGGGRGLLGRGRVGAAVLPLRLPLLHQLFHRHQQKQTTRSEEGDRSKSIACAYLVYPGGLLLGQHSIQHTPLLRHRTGEQTARHHVCQTDSGQQTHVKGVSLLSTRTCRASGGTASRRKSAQPRPAHTHPQSMHHSVGQTAYEDLTQANLRTAKGACRTGVGVGYFWPGFS